MNLRLLIDGIVQQTTVLVAQLSTTSGVRSPLSHVVDRVFLDLARELERQGVRKNVAADMFGLVLRSYQKKVQRLAESATFRDRTLWEAVLSAIEAEPATRTGLLARFHADGEAAIVSVVNDLLETGLVFTTGTGDDALFGVTSDAVRERLVAGRDVESVATFVWVAVFRHGPVLRADLPGLVRLDRELATRAVEELLESGRLEEQDGMLRAANFVVPLGSELGWEAAILDHFRAVASAITSKVRSGARSSAGGDRVGGSTFTFNLTPGHPFETQAYGLLSRLRQDVQSLWDGCAEYNRSHPPDPELATKLTFYLGQTIEEQDDEPSGSDRGA